MACTVAMFRRWSGRFAACLLMLAMVMCLAVVPARAADTSSSTPSRVVTVGYNNLPGFLYTDEAGNYKGYAFELLQQISAYTGWDFKYVDVPYSEIGEKLASGEIDVYVPHQRTPERELLFEYGNEVFCTNQASLLTKPEADIYYKDWDNFDGLKVGCEIGTRNGDRFIQEFANHDCTLTLVNTYTSIAQMAKALDDGEIDAFICASNRGVTGYRVIDELDSTDSYVLARKGDRSLLDSIDDAIAAIETDNPLFISQLEERYRIAAEGSYPALTRDEVNYIKAHPEVTTLVGRQDIGSSGELTGSIGMVLNQVTKTTGLTFVPVTGADTKELFDKLDAGEADMMFSFDYDFNWADQHNVAMTEPYASFNMTQIRRGEVGEPHTVAVSANTYLSWYVSQYLDYEVIPCDSYRDGIEMVKKGTADATLVNATYANYYATFPEYSGLVFSTRFDLSSSYAVGVSNMADRHLLSILNKAMACIPPSKLAEYFDVQINSREPSPFDIYYENPVFAYGVTAALTLLILLVIGGSIGIRTVHNKNLELSAANKAKGDFLGRMSHELRTPINAISGSAELARQTLDSSAPDRDQKLRLYADDTSSSAAYLLSLVNDILDMTKIDNDRITLVYAPINIASLIRRIKAMIDPLAKAKGITFNVVRESNVSEWFMADGTRIQQIVMNLLNNAIKFTPDGGTVTLTGGSVGTDPEGMETMRITVSDTGVGMSEEFQKRMFTPFTQESNSSTTPYTGTGLGLVISRRLARLMDGDITCKSTLGEGSTFTVIIKAKPIEAPANAQSDDEPSDKAYDLAGAHVLLAEDNQLNSSIACQLLANKGCLVDAVVDGQQAVDAFSSSEHNHYCVVLMDIRMPQMDGFEATKAIRALNRKDATQVRILAMSANAFDDDIEASRASGMDGHIAKPIDVAQLYQAVGSAYADLKARQAED